MTPENQAIALQFALKEMPREACGLVIIEKGKEVFVPCRNISLGPQDFEIHPEDFARAEDRGEIIEIFHSHCYVRAKPSESDLVSCERTGLKWSIVSVPNGEWVEFFPSGFKAPLVGRNWSHGVLDCYSLIRDYYKEELGIELMDFDREQEWWLTGENLYIENFEKAGFSEVPLSEMKLHDVLLMQIGAKVVNHGGVYIGNDRVLHHFHRRLSCRDILSGYYRRHIVKVVRYKGL